MKRPKVILLTIAVLILAAILFLYLSPEGPLDLSNDEEPFRSMVLPPKSVEVASYMDHGSAAMRLIDQNDVEYWITFPIDYDSFLDSHPLAFEGQFGSKMTPLKNSARAKKIAARLIRDYAREDEYGQKKIVLRVLTHRTIPFRIQRLFE